MPIDETSFQLALEDWRIWLRWLDAGPEFCDSFPVLPADRKRHEQIKALLGDSLEIMGRPWTLARGYFANAEDGLDPRRCLGAMKVRWVLTSSP